MTSLTLERVSKTFADGTEALRDLDLAVADGELVALVGPSGCGKSTALRLIAGLDTPTAGRIRMDGAPVDHWAPQARNTAMVFQSYSLYPHMTVAGNLEFPLKMRGAPKAERRRQAAEMAELLGIGDLLHRRPAALSGGQLQRAAMGRALVRNPTAFLMDEPLSNLDAKLRVRLRHEIATLQARLAATVVYVTHDQAEALTLGHRVAVLRDGVLQQSDVPERLYREPANIFVAGFLGSPGMNILRAPLRRRWKCGWLELGRAGRVTLPRAVLPSVRGAGETPRLAGIRPEAFKVPEAVAPGQRLRFRLRTQEYLGHEVLAYLEPPVPAVDPETSPARIQAGSNDHPALVARLPGGADLPESGEIALGLDASAVCFFDAWGQRLL